MVNEPVNERRSEPVIAKDAIPLSELDVGGNDDTLSLVALGHHVEKELSTVGVQWDKTKLIDDEKVNPVKLAQQARQAPFTMAFQKLVDKIQAAVETDGFAFQAGLETQSRGQVRFACPDRSQGQHVFVAREESEVNQISPQSVAAAKSPATNRTPLRFW